MVVAEVDDDLVEPHAGLAPLHAAAQPQALLRKGNADQTGDNGRVRALPVEREVRPQVVGWIADDPGDVGPGLADPQDDVAQPVARVLDCQPAPHRVLPRREFRKILGAGLARQSQRVAQVGTRQLEIHVGADEILGPGQHAIDGESMLP